MLVRRAHARSSAASPLAAVAGSAEEKELDQKIRALAKARFGDDSLDSIKKLFLSYDADHNGKASRDELERLLKDAGVGNSITRSSWVDGIFDKLDVSPKDDQITWPEYVAALPKGAAPGGGGVSPEDVAAELAKISNQRPAAETSEGLSPVVVGGVALAGVFVIGQFMR